MSAIFLFPLFLYIETSSLILPILKLSLAFLLAPNFIAASSCQPPTAQLPTTLLRFALFISSLAYSLFSDMNESDATKQPLTFSSCNFKTDISSVFPRAVDLESFAFWVFSWGLASYLHCNNFTSYLPNTTTVKCLGDAGFFMDSPDITMNHTQRTFFQHLVTLQGIEQNLDENCTTSITDPKQCIFPQYLLKYITPPVFILNSAYDVYQLIEKLTGMELVVMIVLLVSAMLTCAGTSVSSDDRLLVNMTVVHSTTVLGAYCLDGSLPAYHIHRGFGAGARNWLLQFEGGGWCNDIETCAERAKTRRGSTRLMNKLETFSGILSDNPDHNPDFYNWSRVKLRYCDGGSFAGDNKFDNGTLVLFFRGQRIWKAIIEDLLPKGMRFANKALLSGCSAGGLASYLHCNNFTSYLPNTTTVKCLGDAGFFMDSPDITMNHTQRTFFQHLVTLQGIEQNLDENCTTSITDPKQCIFPQYLLKYITPPVFILNSAYDVYQFHHILVPPSADPRGHWNHCKLNPKECLPNQISVLQAFRVEMLTALRSFVFYSRRGGGTFINSCFAHCQSESQDTWFAPDSPQLHNQTIAESVGDWYFGRNVSIKVDCPYPCDTTCHNLIGANEYQYDHV